MPLRKIAFIIEDFAIGGAAQQLLDRFLIGYFRDGEFRRVPELKVSAWLVPPAENASSNADAATSLAVRARDFGLIQAESFSSALQDADGAVLVAPGERLSLTGDTITRVLEHLRSGAACFVHGALETNRAAAERAAAIADARRIALASGTTIRTTFRLPEVDVPAGTPITDAVIVVQGPQPVAELWGIDGLLPVIARRKGGETGIRAVRHLAGRDLWHSLDGQSPTRSLLAAAISRSNTPQGDPVTDGRTQDLVGLGLVEKLARSPRGWVIEHRDGLRSTVLVLDGVVADFNFAVHARDGTIFSAQLYRPPAPNRSEFDPLAAAIEDFFATRKLSWGIEQSLLASGFLEHVIAARAA